MISRRQFVNSTVQTALLATLPVHKAWSSQQMTNVGLRELAPSGMLVGTVVDQWQAQDPRWVALIIKNFNLVTLGKLKWGYVRPTSDAFDFRETDWMVAFCAAHRLKMHGHNLCWNASNPAWLQQKLTRTNAASILGDHIKTVVSRYSGKISSWDVVNEPVAPWLGRADGLYSGPWLDTLGPHYIDLAFHATAEADPAALRVLNVAHVEQGGKGCDTARTFTLRLVEALLKRNVPVQAIGFESHLAGDYAGGSTPSRSAFVHELKQFGLQILITELDVDDTHLTGDIVKRDAKVSRCYSDYLTSMLREAQPSRLIFFSPSDERNWYDSAHSSQYTRADGARHRPGLFDASLLPKSSYTSTAEALKGQHA